MRKLTYSLLLISSCWAFGQVELQRTVIGATGHSFQSEGITLISASHQSSLIGSSTSSTLQLHQGFIQPFHKIQIARQHFIIFPNPTTGKTTIQAASITGAFQMQVYNLEGKQVFAEEFSAEKTFYWTEWPKGLYHIRLYDQGTIIGTHKLMIK